MYRTSSRSIALVTARVLVSWKPTPYVWPPVVQISITCPATALPSFVRGGTNTHRARQPFTVIQPPTSTLAPGYQPGPLTNFA